MKWLGCAVLVLLFAQYTLCDYFNRAGQGIATTGAGLGLVEPKKAGARSMKLKSETKK